MKQAWRQKTLSLANAHKLPYFPVIASEWNKCGDSDKNQKRNIYYPGLRSNRFADIASLSLVMTRLLLKAPQAHNVSQLPYFPVIANEWNECGDPDNNQKKEMHVILDCEATALRTLLRYRSIISKAF